MRTRQRPQEPRRNTEAHDESDYRQSHVHHVHALASSPAIESPEVGWKTDDGNGQKKDRESHENAIEAHSSRPHARESLRNPANDGYRSTQRRFIAGPSRRSSGDCASFPTARSLPSVFAYRVNEPRPGQLSPTFCASLGVSGLAF